MAGGYPSPDGLGRLIEANVIVRDMSNLHAKAYIADEFGLLGSANLTGAGMALITQKNAELSTVLSPQAVLSARSLCRCGGIHLIVVDDALSVAEAQAAEMPSSPAASVDRPQTSPALEVERLLAEARATEGALWIKAQSDAPRPDQWRKPYWFSNPGPGKPSLEAGDLALIYAKGIHGCYAVVEITDTATFDPDYVTENSGGDPEIGKR